MIYVFYNNDPLAQDLGGGAEHFRGLHRALLKSGLEFQLVAARMQDVRDAPNIHYISRGSNFLRYYLALWRWFWTRRRNFRAGDVFHFHRNYAAWPKLTFCPGTGRVLISYHNVTGQVLQGWLGSLASPIRKFMLMFERRVTSLADAIVCVSDRDRETLANIVVHEPFERAGVIPATYDEALFGHDENRPPSPRLAHDILLLGRISHQKNVPLAISVVERLRALGHDFRLTIAGDGEDSRQLIRRIAESPASAHIKWVGCVPHDEVPAIIHHHGMLLLTSRYEASPTVVKEALRCMRPVVSTDVGDVPDWIEEGQTGFICDADPISLAEGCLRAATMIGNGTYRSTDRIDDLSEDAIMTRVMQLYRRLQAV
ncbi:MAG: glycosyltransferase family 4 protein [Geminicoccaceae bacterium]|nr:glycosyltransferase family 4 protein [Geminicoccaceae bacterium]